jgi:hypothetical protein
MKENKTILPASVLVSLFKDSLVLPENKINPAIIEEQIASLAADQEAFVKKNKVNLPAQEQSNTTEVTIAEEEVKLTIPLKHLGDHSKKIVVIVDDPASVYLNEPDFILLTSILNACRLTIADIALVNIGNQKASLHQILNNLPSKLVIAFEVDSKALKIKLPTNLYKLTPLGDSNLLFSKSLSSMQGLDSAAKQEKAKLWAVLKQIFQL